MKNTGTGLVALAFLLIAGTVGGQDSNYNFTVQTLGGYTTPGLVPFWLRSNQFGSIPLDGASLSFIGAAKKDYDLFSDKLFDWGASFEGRANLGQGSNLTLIEGYGKVRLGIFELRAGRSKKITGLCDTTLTSGSWAVSGTSLGIPEIELAVRDFWSVPWFGQLFAFKGNYSHGWMGEKYMSRYILHDTVTVTSYLHQKSLYGRFGKTSWRLKLYGGFNHQVVWGDEQDYYLDEYTLTPIQTYFYVITGKRYSNGYIQQERQGNHLGSIDLGLEYKFENIRLTLYRQSIYEAGGLAHLANIEDGLNGLSIENLKLKSKAPIVKKILVEVLYTKKQSKDSWSPYVGEVYFEPYYNHGQYTQGWLYSGVGLGTPFVGTRENIRDELASDPSEYFINNRVLLYHLGVEGSVRGISYTFKCSLSNNYGTYLTAGPDEAAGISDAGEFGLFGIQKQFSSYLAMDKIFESGLSVGLVGAFDYGDLYYNSFGMFLRASYSLSL
ncbi:MAG: hypothetical protein IH591_05170 [Bacteroidales bacterium]|nr:hypothetical protein [Bacteroidales bacterium]